MGPRRVTTAFQKSARVDFIGSPLYDRNMVGGTQFPSVGVGGVPFPANAVGRISHRFFPFTVAQFHWHSLHFPSDFHVGRMMWDSLTSLNFIDLPVSLTGWQRCFIRVKGVAQLFPERSSYVWNRISAWDDPLGPSFHIGGPGVLGTSPIPNFSSSENFGHADNYVFGPLDLHSTNDVVVNYGSDLNAVVEIDRLVELSINTAVGRRIQFGGREGWSLLGGNSILLYFTGGTMPDGTFLTSSDSTALTGQPIQPSAGRNALVIYMQNPGLNPISLQTGLPMFPAGSNINGTHQLIGQLMGTRSDTQGRAPRVSDY